MKSAIGIRLAALLNRYPLVKNVFIPLALLYLVWRPVTWLFGSKKVEVSVAKELDTAKVAAVVKATGAGSEKASSSAEFMHEHLNAALTKTSKDYKAIYKEVSRPGTQGQGSSLNPSAATLEYRKRLNLDPASVVTVAVNEDLYSEHFVQCIKALSSVCHVFVLAKLKNKGKGAEGWAEAAAQMRQLMAPLTSTSVLSDEEPKEGKDKSTGTDTGSRSGSSSDPHLPQHRLLMSQTLTGRTAAVRQLKSTLHIDFDRDVCRTIEQHVRSTVLVSDVPSESSSPRHITSTSLGSPIGFSKDGIIMMGDYAKIGSLHL